MKILVIGSGGREHALAWALHRSSHVREILTTSANPGILRFASRATVDPGNLDAIADYAQSNAIDLTVIGPEQPLVDGLGDRLIAKGLAVFGPRAAAARLEGSKVFLNDEEVGVSKSDKKN